MENKAYTRSDASLCAERKNNKDEYPECTNECVAAADIEVAYHRYTEPDFFCGDYEPKGGEENG